MLTALQSAYIGHPVARTRGHFRLYSPLGLRRYSGLMLAVRITLPHFSVS
jgi:hypothetical protein